MKRSRYSDEQIAYALRQAESGTAVGDVCRQLGIAEATFYVWKKKYANLGATELRELRQLREENSKLKRLVADLTLDRHHFYRVGRRRGRRDSDPTQVAGVTLVQLVGHLLCLSPLLSLTLLVNLLIILLFLFN